MISLTHEQSRLYRFIETSIHESGGVAPAYHEMALHMGFSEKSKGVIHKMILALEERGVIRRLPKKARAIELTHVFEAHICPNCGFRSSNHHDLKPTEPSLKFRFSRAKAANNAVDALPGGGKRQ